MPKRLKLRMVVGTASTKIPHYSRETDLIPTYGSKYRAARLYTTHSVHIRVTLVLQVSGMAQVSSLDVLQVTLMTSMVHRVRQAPSYTRLGL